MILQNQRDTWHFPAKCASVHIFFFSVVTFLFEHFIRIGHAKKRGDSWVNNLEFQFCGTLAFEYCLQEFVVFRYSVLFNGGKKKDKKKKNNNNVKILVRKRRRRISRGASFFLHFITAFVCVCTCMHAYMLYVFPILRFFFFFFSLKTCQTH